MDTPRHTLIARLSALCNKVSPFCNQYRLLTLCVRCVNTEVVCPLCRVSRLARHVPLICNGHVCSFVHCAVLGRCAHIQFGLVVSMLCGISIGSGRSDTKTVIVCDDLLVKAILTHTRLPKGCSPFSRLSIYGPIGYAHWRSVRPICRVKWAKQIEIDSNLGHFPNRSH